MGHDGHLEFWIGICTDDLKIIETVGDKLKLVTDRI